ncbi:MAG: OB-fold nucleic acid binding domain-containing protein, partial [Chloroflexota bacterium]
MPINAEPLRKILALESKKGYSDSAVFGGLDKFLRNWTAQARESIISTQLLKRFNELLVNSDYSSLTKDQRQYWMNQVLDLVSDIESEKDKVQSKPPSVISTPPPKPTPKRTLAEQSLDAPITIVKGISSVLESRFNKLGVRTVRDLLYFFPRRHIDYSQRQFISQLTPGEEQTIIANVWEARQVMIGGRRRSTEATVGDETGNIRVVWFNNPYLAKTLKTNSRIVISGRVTVFKGRNEFQSPEWEFLEDKELTHAGRLVPLYPLTQGLKPRAVRRLMKEFIDRWAGYIKDFIPAELKVRRKLLELPVALRQAHFPDNEALKNQARTRLAFDELFILQLGVLSKRRNWQESQPGIPLTINRPVLDAFLNSLPFKLTGAQNKSLNEILTDLSKRRPMSRLLQGEVGSGKTVVATAALLMSVVNGYQSAFMAP